MKPLSAFLCSAPLLAVACAVDLTIPEYVPKCDLHPAPLLAGTWTGTLGGQPLTMQITETCSPPSGLGDSDHWADTGQWQWGGLSGQVSALPYYFGGATPVLLSLGPTLGVKDNVRLMVPDKQIPAVSRHLAGIAVGSWPKPEDPSQVVARFDSVAFDVTRP
jgi:hypothetical protein